MTEIPELGVQATVVMDRETHRPCRIQLTEDEGHLRRVEVADPEDDETCASVLVCELPIVSSYTLHVALYALQNPTPENIGRALMKIGTSGDCEEWIDSDTLLPLPVSAPGGWDKGW